METLIARKKLSDSTGDFLLRSLFEKLPDAALIFNQNRLILNANPAFCQLFGCSRESVLNQCLDRCFSGGIASLPKVLQQPLLAVGEQHSICTLSGDNGITRFVELTVVPNVCPGNHLAVFHDRTEHQRTVDALCENVAALNTIIDHSPDAIYLLDLQTHQVTFNR